MKTKVTFDEMLQAQSSTKKKPARGKFSQMIDSMPDSLSEHVVVCCWDNKELTDVRAAIKKYRGDKYTAKVVISLVKGVSNWGINLWSDRLFFTPQVFKNLSKLEERDRRFIEMIAGTTLTGFVAAVEKKDE